MKPSASGELRPAPLDERIARLYYGRGKNGKAMASPSAPGSRSKSPLSRNEQRLVDLHASGTITSSIRLISKPAHADDNHAEGAVMRDGTANGHSNLSCLLLPPVFLNSAPLSSFFVLPSLSYFHSTARSCRCSILTYPQTGQI